jgi:hypothetical protein
MKKSSWNRKWISCAQVFRWRPLGCRSNSRAGRFEFLHETIFQAAILFFAASAVILTRMLGTLEKLDI